MRTLGQTALTPGENESRTLGSKHARTREKINLLSIGAIDHCYALYDALMEEGSSRTAVAQNCRELWMIPDYRELWVIPKHEAVHVAILHTTGSSFELDEACRFIRHQWPSAKIVVVDDGEDFLDDALYDDRLMPGTSTEVLLRVVDELLACQRP